MTLLDTLLTALTAGAAASLQSTASQAILDGYASLKALIQSKFGSVDLTLLEKDPASKARRLVLAEELEKSKVSADDEVQQAVHRLLAALVQEKVATLEAMTQAIGIDLAEIRAASATISDIVVQGRGAVTGVKIKGAVLDEGLQISGVRVRNTPSMPQAAAAKQIKILFLAANPSDTAKLQIDEEVRAIDQALRLAAYRNFDLATHWAVRSEDLQRLLLRHQPDIVHFSGHATGGEILLQDAAGNVVPVSAIALRNLFQTLKDRIRCVVLNACYSQAQAAAIAEVIDAVVGMSSAIQDEAARHFASAFYGALGYGKTVAEAFRLGCVQLDLDTLDESQVPILLPGPVNPETIRFVEPSLF